MIICFQLEFCLVHPLQPTSRGRCDCSPLLVLCCSWPLPFCPLQSPGNPTRCEWRTRRPWEAVSPSSSALSLLLLRPTSLLYHGKKTQFRWAQVWPLILCVMDEHMHIDVPFFSIRNVSAVSHLLSPALCCRSSMALQGLVLSLTGGCWYLSCWITPL